MPDRIIENKKWLIEYLKYKNKILIDNSGRILYPEDLESDDFKEEVVVNFHA